MTEKVHVTNDAVAVSLQNQSLGAGELKVDAWGVQKVSLPHSVFHGMWTFDIPASMWFMYENGTQVYTSTDVTSTGGAGRLLTTASNTVLLMDSRECPRYQPNRGQLFSTAGWFPSKTADGIRDFGLFTAENGVFFRLKADGLLYAVLRRGGSEFLEEVINTSGLTGFDVEKNNIYDIQFQWRGAGDYNFYIGSPATGGSKLVHTFSILGTLTTLSMEDPALPIAYKATRTTENVEMNIGCADVTAENGSSEVHQYKSTYAQGVIVNGTNIPVLAIKVPLQIDSKTNTRTLQLARISVKCAKKATFKFWVTRDASAFTGATFVELGNGSFVQTDSPDRVSGATRATAFTTTNAEPLVAVPAEAGVWYQVDNPLRERIHFPMVRGDYLVVTVNVSTSTADATIEWGEAV